MKSFDMKLVQQVFFTALTSTQPQHGSEPLVRDPAAVWQPQHPEVGGGLGHSSELSPGGGAGGGREVQSAVHNEEGVEHLSQHFRGVQEIHPILYTQHREDQLVHNIRHSQCIY